MPMKTPKQAWPGTAVTARTSAVPKPYMATYPIFSHSAKPSETNTAYTTPSNWQLKFGLRHVRARSSRNLNPSSESATTMKFDRIR